MQFLSVAGRELRVAARKRSSFRVRMLTSVIALFMSGFALWFVTLFGNRPMSGDQLFSCLSWVSFVCACIIGPVLTADCVNEERNNGTLGLLFLTNLDAISISLGKLVGHGLLALYSIISIMPVMALPALLGGADAQSLAKTALVLLITLVLSLTIGMFASTVCRQAWRATGLSLFILAILAAGLPPMIKALRLTQRIDWAAILELLSPSYALSMASASAAMLPSNRLWIALVVQALFALLFFGVVTFFLPRVWKEGKSGKRAVYFFAMWRALKYGSGEARRKLRTRLLHINPILWLSSRERFGPMGFAVVLLVLVFAISWTGKNFPLGPVPNAFLSSMIAWIMGIPLLYICFCFRLASAASERFAADRKAGALELIVCTPLKTREIVRGHWLGLIRRFWGAATVLLALHGFALYYIMEAIRIENIDPGLAQFDFREVIVRPVRHIFGAARIANEVAPFYIACLAVLTAAILIVILWIALGWLGMALSLKLRREIFAPWISLILLAVPPIPLFAGSVALLDNKKLFASDLFLALFRLGATGFFIVLGNALLWLFLARLWTYGKLRAATRGPLALRQGRQRVDHPLHSL
jgi:ABC-type transport system involved in multi-copper enzyme maturation permease subunit